MKKIVSLLAAACLLMGAAVSSQAQTAPEEAVQVSSYTNTTFLQAQESLESKETLNRRDFEQMEELYTVTSEPVDEEYSVYYLKAKEPLARAVYSDGSEVKEYSTRAVLTRTKEDVDGSLSVVMWSEMRYETKQYVESTWWGGTNVNTGYRITLSTGLIKSFGERYGRNYGTRCIQVGENLETKQVQRFEKSYRWGDRIVGNKMTFYPGFSGYSACEYNGTIGTDVYVDVSHNGSTYSTFKIEIREGNIPNV